MNDINFKVVMLGEGNSYKITIFLLRTSWKNFPNIKIYS